MSVLFVRAL